MRFFWKKFWTAFGTAAFLLFLFWGFLHLCKLSENQTGVYGLYTQIAALLKRLLWVEPPAFLADSSMDIPSSTLPNWLLWLLSFLQSAFEELGFG